ncbi:MAG TPA: YraN family protein [Candidatus Saccharimonadales bacterium]|nr:YraN family protein [Candidatus Saccharimonadales bacterium]
MSTTAIGRQAEQAAAEFLRGQGYEILEHNWRTRWCEIDLVARKGGCVHFVEVKYRSQDGQGSGLEYITSAKLKQMRYAAEHWTQQHNWSGAVNLAAVEVCAPDYAISEFVESIY